MVWEQIQAARRSKAHLHIVWLDLANAYRSLPHLLITFALEFFHIPASLPQELLCLLHNPGSLHQLAPAGISPILFTAVFEAILMGSRQVACRVKAQSRQRLTSSEHYMDYVTTLLQAATCTSRK